MILILQADGLGGGLWWTLGALAVLIAIFYLTRRQQYKERIRDRDKHDPRQNVVNDSSYNINREGIDGHRTEGHDAEDARRAVDDFRQTGEMPSEEEFRDLRDDMKQ